MRKKRILLPTLHAAITRLSSMAADIAKLEIADDNFTSLKLKNDIIEFKCKELAALHRAILTARDEVNETKRKKKLNHKTNNHEQPTTTTGEEFHSR